VSLPAAVGASRASANWLDNHCADRIGCAWMNEPRTVLPRVLGGMTGLMLMALAATAWLLAHIVAGLIATGEHYVEGRIPDGETQAARMALGSLESAATSVFGTAAFATQRFEGLVLIALAGGLLCTLTALRRKPHDRWPELAWVASAALALVPGTVMHAWWLVSVPLAAGAVLAAVVHFKRRHGLRLRRR
jgi:succinate dehydrogenase hydrophobic anchor subunit